MTTITNYQTICHAVQTTKTEKPPSLWKKNFKTSDQPHLSAWTRIKEYFSNPSPTFRALREMAADTKLNKHFNKERKQVIYEAFQSNEFQKLRPFLSTIFSKISTGHLEELLRNMINQSFQEDTAGKLKSDPKQVLERIQSIVCLQKLEETVKINFSHFTGAQNSAVQTAEIVKGPFAMDVEETRKTIMQTGKLYILNALDKAINFFLMFFNLSDLIKEPDHPWEMMYKWQVLLQLWTSITTALTAISALVGNAYLAALIAGTGVAGGAVFLFAYFQWLRPAPENIKGCINFTSEAAKNHFEPVLAREVIVDKVINKFASNAKGSRSQPLMVGNPGVGKTEIAKELARRIVSGNVPPFMKDFKVQYINCADLSIQALEEILKQVKGYEHKTIFIFDEFATLFKGDASNVELIKLSEKVKSLLDTTPGSFPYVVLLTTWAEYRKFIQGNHPVERRTELTPVEETTEDQTVLILNNQIYREAPHIRISETALKLIYTATSNKNDFPHASQPDKSKKILSKAISKVRTGMDPKIAQTLQNLRDKRSFLSCSFMRGRGSELILDTENGQKLIKEFKAISDEITKMEEALKAESDNFKKMGDLQEKYNALRDNIFRVSMKIRNAPKEKDKLDGLLKQFILLEYYLNPALLETIQQWQKSMPKVSTEITEAMIAEIIAQEKELQQAAAIS